MYTFLAKISWKLLAMLVFVGVCVYAWEEHKAKVRAKEADHGKDILLKDSEQLLSKSYSYADSLKKESEQATLNRNSELAKHLQKETALKRLVSLTRLHATFRTDTVTALYSDTARKAFKTPVSACIKVEGMITSSGVKIKSSIAPINLQLTIGRKRQAGFWGFLKKRLPTAEVKSDNPCLIFNQVQSVSFQ